MYLLLLAIGANSCMAQKPTKTIGELNSHIQEVFDKSTIPGFSVIVVDDSNVLYQYSLGYADIATKRKYAGSTIQNIASVSKTFIGVALMIAEEQGKLRLDDEINDYLPFKVQNPNYPNTPIIIRHLANHTSSINDGELYQRAYVLENPVAEAPSFPKELRKYVSLMKQNERMDESIFLENILSKNGRWFSSKSFTKTLPGTKYNYSNIGASLAAYVIENAVGMSYENYTREYIFKALQMSDTGWDASDVDMNQHATRYFDVSTPIPNYYLVTRADGALMTNTTDFGKYLMEMIKGYDGNGTLLKPISYIDMFTRKEFGNESSGIFWGVSKSGNPNHSGSDPGVITIASVNPRKKLGIFFMSNFDIDNNKKAMKSVIKILNSIKIHQWEK